MVEGRDRKGMRTRTPTFWTEGTVPHFSRRKGEEFAVICFNRSDLRRLNHNIPFSARPGPRWQISRRSPRPHSRGGDIFPTHSPLLSSRSRRAFRSPSELVRPVYTGVRFPLPELTARVDGCQKMHPSQLGP